MPPGRLSDPPAAAKHIEEARRITELYERLNRTDHYTLLGVTATADLKEIKRAYFALAKAYHPDRFFRQDIGALAPKVDAVFRALTTALETLADPESRARYDAYFRDLLKTRMAARSALALERKRDWNAAVAAWSRVLESLPSDAYVQHRLAYSLLRACTPNEAAVEAIERAISLDPTRAEYRLTAASLYLAVGLERKALAELQVACELEPEHAYLAGLHAAIAIRCSEQAGRERRTTEVPDRDNT